MKKQVLKVGMRVTGQDVLNNQLYRGVVFAVARDGNSATIRRSDGVAGGGMVIDTQPYYGKQGWLVERREGDGLFGSDGSDGALTLITNHHRLVLA